MLRKVPALLALLLALTATAAPKRRAVRVVPSIDETTVTGWLSAHAFPLASTELQSYSYDLERLRPIIGEADVVALGEGTHGTREFHTVKLRIADFLAREMGFDVVAIEAPFPLFNRVDQYAQGGAGEPKAMLGEVGGMGYPFWKSEEILALIEWTREYNAHRGERPPVRLVGMDVLDQVAASKEVVTYLQSTDPAAAAEADSTYSCIRGSDRSDPCYAAAARIYDSFVSRESELIARSSAAAYHEARHHARVVVQSQYPYGPHRDNALAENTLWIREHRGGTRRVIVWAHNEHVSRSPSPWAGDKPMGATLSAALGAEYFGIATLTGRGTFHQWQYNFVTAALETVTSTFAIQPRSYESYFQQHSVPAYFFSLRGTLPSWLTTATLFNAGTTNKSDSNFVTGSLPEKFDAAFYIDATTPTRLLP